MLCDPTQRYIVTVLVRILSRHPTLQFMMAACAAFLKSGPGHVLQPVTVAGGARRGGGGGGKIGMGGCCCVSAR